MCNLLPARLFNTPAVSIAPIIVWADASIDLALRVRARVLDRAYPEGASHGSTYVGGRLVYWCRTDRLRDHAIYAGLPTTKRASRSIVDLNIEVTPAHVLALQNAEAALLPFACVLKGSLQLVPDTTAVQVATTTGHIKAAKKALAELQAVLGPVNEAAAA